MNASLLFLQCISLVFTGFYKDCASALKDNDNKPNTYMIKPLDLQVAYNISCKMENHVAWTIFSHDRETDSMVEQLYGPSAIKVFKLAYNVSLATIAAFVDRAASCRQYTYARCLGTAFVFRGFCWLSDRNNNKMTFWGGGPTGGRGCECGITNSCVSPTFGCNCDANDNQFRSDQGYITSRDHLPITSITLGALQQIYYRIGKLECRNN